MCVPKLDVVPTTWLSWDFKVSSEGRALTTLELTRFRERGRFVLDGAEYTVSSEGPLRRSFRLERAGRPIARAERRGLFRATFTVQAGERTLTLRQRGLLGYRYEVEHNRTRMGGIARALVKRRAVADLDDRIEPAVRIFLLFLAQVEWRRDSRRSG
jgi:hypothetical protein